MKICVLGVGRSGTTALYVLLQHIMLSTCKEPIDFVYEPFLRDKDTFNGIYNEVIGNSPYVNSLSFEGIFHHLELPLFIDNPVSYKNNLLLHKIFKTGDTTKHLLVKFTRSNGRYLLVNEVCPENKSIFIIRNPVDVANSIIRRFSFFGGEFHRDDFPKFIREINKLFHLTYAVDGFKSQMEKELLYWLYMNKFALESITMTKKKALLVCYEEYVKNRSLHIKKICNFLNFDFKVEFLNTANKRVGSVTDKFEISREEFEIFEKYLEEYFRLLNTYHIDFSFTENEILARYTIVKEPIRRGRPFYGLHSRAITRNYQRLLEEKDEQLNRKDELIKKLQTELKEFKSHGLTGLAGQGKRKW